MSANDTLNTIINNQHLSNYPFRYCLVAPNKLPYRLDGKLAKPNNPDDFVSLEEISKSDKLESYAGIGISIIESKISAIDVDSCFNTPFDLNSADQRAKEIIEMFKTKAYIEFSFSGKGLRILFHSYPIDKYNDIYYIKNSHNDIEFYQPDNSARYVTLTGRAIYNNPLDVMKDNSTLMVFLDKYMKRKIIHTAREKSGEEDSRNIDELLVVVRNHYLTDFQFQNLWFNRAEGSKNGESDHDWYLLLYLFDNVTKDKEKLRLLFEASPRFKSKDKLHRYKWEYQNHRYFNFMWERL